MAAMTAATPKILINVFFIVAKSAVADLIKIDSGYLS